MRIIAFLYLLLISSGFFHQKVPASGGTESGAPGSFLVIDLQTKIFLKSGDIILLLPFGIFLTVEYYCIMSDYFVGC